MDGTVHKRVKDFLLHGTVDPLKKANVSICKSSGKRVSKKERQKLSMEKPKVYLLPDFDKEFIYFLDLQHLLLRCMGGPEFNARTRWCRLLRPSKLRGVTVAVVEHLDFTTAKTLLPKTMASFSLSIKVDSTLTYGCSVLDELIYAPVTPNRLAKLSYDSLPANSFVANNTDESCNIPRTAILLSASQMLAEGYPLPPPDGVTSSVYEDYCFSSPTYHPVSDTSPIFAVDCEMCLTSCGLLELVRVSVINEKLECILDMLVKPYNQITDYLTPYSGVTSETLANVTNRLKDAQEKLQSLLPSDAIICGHSLSSDLHALKLFHPYAIDTSVIFNLSGSYYNKSSLKRLASYFLGVDIQNESRVGHCSDEDARATMRLVQLKMSRNISFGDFVANSQFENTNMVTNMPHCSSYSRLSFSESIASLGLLTKCSFDVTGLSEKQIFYRHAGNNRFYESLFSIAEQCGRPSALISFDWPPPEASSPSLRLLRCMRDKHVARFARRMLTKENGEEAPFFAFVQFLGYAACQRDESVTEENKRSILARLDERLSRLMSNTRKNSLFILLTTGVLGNYTSDNDNSDHKWGLCCLKIT